MKNLIMAGLIAFFALMFGSYSYATPDLTVQGFTTTPIQNGYHIRANVRNIGTSNVNTVTNISWYFNGELIGAGSYGPHRVGSTRADYSDNDKLDFIVGERLPGNISNTILTAGTHTIRYCVDVDNYVNELRTDNNCDTVRVTFTSPSNDPQVYVRGGHFDPNHENSLVTICSENIPTSLGRLQDFVVTYRITRNNIHVKTETFRGQQPINECRDSIISATSFHNGLGLSRNSDYRYEVSAVIPGGTRSYRSNNTYRLDVNLTDIIAPIQNKPDLAVQGFTTTAISNGYRVRANVRNIGNQDVNTVTNIRRYFNGEMIGEGSYGPHRVGAARANYSDNAELEFVVGRRLPGNISNRTLTTGTHTIRYCVDVDNVLDEVRTDNNCDNISIRFNENDTPRTEPIQVGNNIDTGTNPFVPILVGFAESFGGSNQFKERLSTTAERLKNNMQNESFARRLLMQQLIDAINFYLFVF